MKPALRLLALPLAAGLLAAAAQAQRLAADYRLTVLTPVVDAGSAPRESVLAFGPLRLAAASSPTGSGLSLEAGERWFARAGVGRSLESDVFSVGGGIRLGDSRSVSMHMLRPHGQERLGLALRYDWRRTYLRLSYEAATRPMNGPEWLRLSAGVQF